MCLGARGGVRGITKGQGTGVGDQGAGNREHFWAGIEFEWWVDYVVRRRILVWG